MRNLAGAEMVGLRDKTSHKLRAVYPEVPEGTDEEIIQKVRDWYYQQSCAAEDELLNLYVDGLTGPELRARRNSR